MLPRILSTQQPKELHPGKQPLAQNKPYLLAIDKKLRSIPLATIWTALLISSLLLLPLWLLYRLCGSQAGQHRILKKLGDYTIADPFKVNEVGHAIADYLVYLEESHDA
jgi:hypothetical protein